MQVELYDRPQEIERPERHNSKHLDLSKLSRWSAEDMIFILELEPVATRGLHRRALAYLAYSIAGNAQEVCAKVKYFE